MIKARYDNLLINVRVRSLQTHFYITLEEHNHFKGIDNYTHVKTSIIFLLIQTYSNT